ncbi:MAG: EamA family transporter [Myxococcaceae bacterium]|jgi:drug/metabolite transporter (DMT)-like permease|nr:EamA family transporter [Myxococcaceae bacterium]MCA3015969.1 EamA family transporter [Myxococcaceae bacterium]
MDPPLLVLGAISALLSAATQAVAHALLKSGRDKLVVRGLIGFVGLVVMAPVAWVAPSPEGITGWLAASAGLHALYQLVLIRAYEAADFSTAYPLARGVAPLATTVLGAWLLGEQLSGTSALGVGVTTSGFVCLVAGARLRPAGVVAAVTAGLLTAAYTWVDAQGVRLAPAPMTFIAWFFVCDGVVMSSLALLTRGRRIVSLVRHEGRSGTIAGLASLLTYGAALVALRLLPVGVASALRETSVVFGVLVARGLLRETVGWRRAAGALLVACGGLLVLVGLHR